MTGPEALTYLAKDVVFRGTITVEGQVRIDGQIEGDIHSTGTLTIGEHGVITGDITAETVITRGKITGTIIASNTLTLLKPGIVIGDIRTPAMSMEAGAIVHGQSDMRATRQGEDHGAPSMPSHDLAVYRRGQRAPDYA